VAFDGEAFGGLGLVGGLAGVFGGGGGFALAVSYQNDSLD